AIAHKSQCPHPAPAVVQSIFDADDTGVTRDKPSVRAELVFSILFGIGFLKKEKRLEEGFTQLWMVPCIY
ncbi:hypothetical protein HispidOSU_016898, partial [Sigmodon hispidus]